MQQYKQEKSKTPSDTQAKPHNTTRGLLFCGDVVAMEKRFTCTEAWQEKLRQYISFCNLEAPLLPHAPSLMPIGGGGSLEHNNQHLAESSANLACQTLKAGPSLHNREESIDDLVRAGFSGFMLANNHIGDYGELGLERSIEKILDSGAVCIGATCARYPDPQALYYTINDTKIAILNAAESQFGMLDSMSAFLGGSYGYRDCFGHEFMQAISHIKQQVDVLICVIHAGLENSLYPLPQFRELYKAFCDMGADCIIAHHPHVIQGYEEYRTIDSREARIFYSLGNFFFSLAQPSTDPLESQGLAVAITFEKQKIKSYELLFSQQADDVVEHINPSALYHSMESLSAPLRDEKLYREKILEIITHFYPQYMRYYEWAFLLPSKQNSLLTNIKLFIKSLFFPERHLTSRQALFLHNINIPTHRFVQELYLKYILYYKEP